MPETSSDGQSQSDHEVVIETHVIPCPLCQSNDFRHVMTAQDPQWGIAGTFDVVACRSCGHRYMNPAPTSDSLPRCYPANYGPHQNIPKAVEGQGSSARVSNTAQRQKSRPWYLRWIPLRQVPGLRRLFYWVLNDKSQLIPEAEPVGLRESKKTSNRAFELGCAAGAYLQKLQAIGWEVEGLEPGPEAAAIADQAGLNVKQGTLDDHVYPSSCYDWIALWMVLEHVPDPRTTLETLFRMQASEGTLALSVPNAGCWEPVIFRRFWDAWDLPRHLHHFRPATIRRLLEETGYEQIDIQHQPNFLNVVSSLGGWLTSVLPSSRIGQWLRDYPHRPQLWMQLLTAPIAHTLAFIGQGGRLTVTARKTKDSGSLGVNRDSLNRQG